MAAIPSIKFKKMVLKLSEFDRTVILGRLMRWVQQQSEHDSKAHELSNWLDRILCGDNSAWHMANIFDISPSFQAIVKSKLVVPTTNLKEINEGKPRKSIPKKIRAQVWEIAFGSTTDGKCYCCNASMKCLETWHAGHIVASANGGTDTVDNLRPICASCNLSMGTENMDSFKNRCYPVQKPNTQSVMINGKMMNILTSTH